MLSIESAAITDVGRKRKNNEDCYFIDSDLNLFVVADGMGGHQAGEVASKVVIDTISEYMKKDVSPGTPDADAFSNDSLSFEAQRICMGIKLANQRVYQLSFTKDAYQGMGSTVSAVYFSENSLIAVNVGDSPIYLVHNGNIETISVPHTVIAEQAAIDPDGISKIDRKFHHMLTRGMGIEENVKPDICELQYFSDDILVISSDGLSDSVRPEEIRDVVCSAPPKKACGELVDLANERGGHDNITVIVMKMKIEKYGIGAVKQFIKRCSRSFQLLFSHDKMSN